MKVISELRFFFIFRPTQKAIETVKSKKKKKKKKWNEMKWIPRRYKRKVEVMKRRNRLVFW